MHIISELYLNMLVHVSITLLYIYTKNKDLIFSFLPEVIIPEHVDPQTCFFLIFFFIQV